MGNVKRLMDAGIIAAGAALSQADQDVINRLTDDEVSALISINSKLPSDFKQRNFGSAGAQQSSHIIGIVF